AGDDLWLHAHHSQVKKNQRDREQAGVKREPAHERKSKAEEHPVEERAPDDRALLIAHATEDREQVYVMWQRFHPSALHPAPKRPEVTYRVPHRYSTSVAATLRLV